MSIRKDKQIIAGTVSHYREIGEVVTSMLPLQDAGLHLIDGELIYSTGIYKEFVAYISKLYTQNPQANFFTTETDWQETVANYGVCGKFVYDSTNSTVRLPKVTGIIEGTIDINALGEIVQAGLPNIAGTFAVGDNTDAYTAYTNHLQYGDGPFYSDSTANLGYNEGAGSGKASIPKFDASRANPIYGNSDTVQPQTVKGFVYIVIANFHNSVAPTEVQYNELLGEIAILQNRITEINTTFTQQLQTQIQEVTNKILYYTCPDYEKQVTVTMPFTATENGWFIAYNLNTSTTVTVNGIGVAMGTWNSGRWSGNLNCQIMVKTGDVVAGATGSMRFIPFIGNSL